MQLFRFGGLLLFKLFFQKFDLLKSRPTWKKNYFCYLHFPVTVRRVLLLRKGSLFCDTRMEYVKFKKQSKTNQNFAGFAEIVRFLFAFSPNRGSRDDLRQVFFRSFFVDIVCFVSKACFKEKIFFLHI